MGFGLLTDLWAIATALGSEGGSCVAVVNPVIDMASVHRMLNARNVPGIRKVAHVLLVSNRSAIGFRPLA